MKRILLPLLTRPVRSPLHSSPVYSSRILAPALFRSLGRHQSEIMFGVLVVVFRSDCVAGLGFSAGERQIPFIASLCIGRARRFRPSTGHPTLWVTTACLRGAAVIHVAL